MENKKIITKIDIINGYNCGLIRFVTDPCRHTDTVCQIGNNCFYFGGKETINCDPIRYLSHVPIADILEKVYDALEKIRPSPSFEKEHLDYMYYVNYLADGLQKSYGPEKDALVRYEVGDGCNIVGSVTNKESALSMVDSMLRKRKESRRGKVRIYIF